MTPLFLFIPFILLLNVPNSTCQEKRITFEDYFQFGKNEYTEKNWPDCVAFMKRAIDDFKQYQDDTVSCRKKCQRQVKPATSSMPKIAQFHETSEVALCLLRCRKDMFGDLQSIRKMSTYHDLEERKPYQYMHICYYHQGELGMAVQSAYTFLVANPEDKDILQSLNWYMNQDGYSDEMLIDMERKDHEAKFINGVEAYDEQDWGRCVHEFETALEKTLIQDEKCRILCQDKIDWSVVEGNPEIDVLLASMRASVVRCEHNCLYKLANINGHYVGNLLAAHFEYLHFCHFKLQRGAEAAQAVANYLLFDDNPLMKRNKYFYGKQYKKDELFTPSQEMLEVYQKRELESRYLEFMEKRFAVKDGELPPEQADDHNPLSMDFHVEDNFEYNGIANLMTKQECKILRAEFDTRERDAFVKELEGRVKNLWPNSSFSSVSCGKHTREAKCTRAIVFSAETDDCGEWLGKWYTGCAVVFCDKKEVMA
ncbi:hypothetical protein CAEBREN_29393 [Caenorhabditis brenneri]|uniref:Leprecan-like alpha-helical domain-containing protein n=1 Tax=Caenorhabditis brenneri TaxID=135651 RepID=G0MQX7_CAEBE|nr:hypothetical protein CAEBREN_29393 [Caenorhabditis brenneri]